MPVVLTDDPVQDPFHTARVMAGLIAASPAQPWMRLLLVLTGGASAGPARADDIRGYRERA